MALLTSLRQVAKWRETSVHNCDSCPHGRTRRHSDRSLKHPRVAALLTRLPFTFSTFPNQLNASQLGRRNLAVATWPSQLGRRNLPRSPFDPSPTRLPIAPTIETHPSAASSPKLTPTSGKRPGPQQNCAPTRIIAINIDFVATLGCVYRFCSFARLRRGE